MGGNSCLGGEREDVTRGRSAIEDKGGALTDGAREERSVSIAYPPENWVISENCLRPRLREPYGILAGTQAFLTSHCRVLSRNLRTALWKPMVSQGLLAAALAGTLRDPSRHQRARTPP